MLNDISSGTDFSNNYNSLISGENERSISNAAQLSGLKKSAALQAAQSKMSSDSDKDTLGEAQDAFSGVMAGKYVDDKMLRGIYEAGGNKFSVRGVKTYAQGEVNKLVGVGTGASASDTAELGDFENPLVSTETSAKFSTVPVSQNAFPGYASDTADPGVLKGLKSPAAANTPSEETKNIITDGESTVEDDGKYLGSSMKLAGAIPGAIDAFKDIANTNSKGNWDPTLAGDNNYEKVSNALAVGSTVLDFIPGMEAVGALGNLASAAIGAYGEMKDKSSLTTTDKATVSPSVKPVLNAGLNFHELGMVSHSSNNSLNLIHGSTAF